MSEVSELHDPSSHYYDPTLTYEAGMQASVRQYVDFATDGDRRTAEDYISAQDVIDKWVVDGEPASRRLFMPEAFGCAAEIVDLAGGYAPSKEFKAVGDHLLTQSATNQKRGGQQVRSVSIHDEPPSELEVWAKMTPDGQHFFPIVSFAEADSEGYLAEIWRVARNNDEALHLLDPLRLWDEKKQEFYLPEEPPLYFAHIYKCTDSYWGSGYRQDNGVRVEPGERPAMKSGRRLDQVEWVDADGIIRVRDEWRDVTPPEFYGIVNCYWTEDDMLADYYLLRRAVKAQQMGRDSITSSAVVPDAVPADAEPVRRRKA